MKLQFRSALLIIALVAIGCMVGAFLDRVSLPPFARAFNVCASGKQFIVEFRVYDGNRFVDRIPGLSQVPLKSDATLEVDGVKVGSLEEVGLPLRKYLCEGNHKAILRIPDDIRGGDREVHEVEFAVSRPSLFHVTQGYQGPDSTKTCVFGVHCTDRIALELSPYEPDDLRARIYPPEKR
jgi:hypothetical protein